MRSRSLSIAVLSLVAVACLPPRSTNASSTAPRRYQGLPGCHSVVTVTDPDIRRTWEAWPSEVAGHDRENWRRVCRGRAF